MFRFCVIGAAVGRLEPAGGGRESDDELRPGSDPWKGNPLGRHDRIAGELHPSANAVSRARRIP